MTRIVEIKKFNNFKVLIKLAMRLHNPQVIQAYRLSLDVEPDPVEAILAKYLKIYPKDSLLDVLMKFTLFYLVDGRLWVQSSNLTWWSQKAETFKPQLVIQYRPVGTRKKFSYNSYAGNPQLHIPHYDGTNSPYLPAYTVGKYSAKYMLDDQTYLMVNASSQEEAVATVAQMAKYTIDYRRPDGEILANISTSTRARKPRIDGFKIEPFKGEYFTGGKNGEKLLVRLQF